MSLAVIATVHRLLHDLLQILSEPNNLEKPFEIGCRTKSPEAQENLYNILCLIVAENKSVVVEKKAEDYIVCFKNEGILESVDL